MTAMLPIWRLHIFFCQNIKTSHLRTPRFSIGLHKLVIEMWLKICMWTCIHSVIDGGIESALQALNNAYGDQTKMTCTPLRSFENFAEHVLGVDHELAKTPFKRIVCDPDEHLHWLTMTISYRGLSSSSFAITYIIFLLIWRVGRLFLALVLLVFVNVFTARPPCSQCWAL